MSSTDERSPRTPGPRHRSRFGPSAVIREGPPSEEVHLLSFFVSGAGHVLKERRRSPRHLTVAHRAWLGWWKRQGEFDTVAARLEDISLGGARLVMNQPPGAHQIVWLCVGIPDPTECVQAKVVAVTPSPKGSFIVRLAFGQPCPHNFYQAAIYGLEREEK